MLHHPANATRICSWQMQPFPNAARSFGMGVNNENGMPLALTVWTSISEGCCYWCHGLGLAHICQRYDESLQSQAQGPSTFPLVTASAGILSASHFWPTAKSLRSPRCCRAEERLRALGLKHPWLVVASLWNEYLGPQIQLQDQSQHRCDRLYLSKQRSSL